MTEKQYHILVNLLTGINKKISKMGTHPVSEFWLSKIQVKQIFGYSDNSLRSIEGYLQISKKRGRKFYSTKSILMYIESGLVHSETNQILNNSSL